MTEFTRRCSVLTLVACLAGLGLAGCSPTHYRMSADREVYGIIKAKSQAVPGMVSDFTIERTDRNLLADLPRAPVEAPPASDGTVTPPTPPAEQATVEAPPASDGTETPPIPPAEQATVEAPPASDGTVTPPTPPAEQATVEAPPAPATENAPAPAAEQGPVVLSLAKALEIASLNSLSYQTQKENVYRQILSLTLQRYAFRPQFFGKVSGDYDATNMGETRKASGSSDFGFSWLLATGTRISAALTTSVSQFLKGDPMRAASSAFSLTITQPILQGAGLPVTESLTQAERDAIYQIRSFVRFRRTFFVDVLNDFYRVLENAQVVQNEQLNLNSLTQLRQRNEAMAEAGRFAQYEVDQVRQQELQAGDRLVRAQQNYEASLDDFKVTLGLSTETKLVLDERELARLTDEGTSAIPLAADRIVELALAHRLDMQTSLDGVEDAQRQVKVAASDLLPGLDLSASLNTDTEGTSSPAAFRVDRTDYSAGFELDLPLDKLSERNNYRRALIDANRAQRDCDQTRDDIVRAVRAAWRQYDRAQRSYEIQKRSVELAKTRVDSTSMLLEAGRAVARDVLDAQEALVGAQNDLAGALVDYKVARLQLARDMGILAVGSKGELEESFDAYQ